MNHQRLFSALNVPDGADLETVERALMEYVKDHIQSIADSYDEKHVQDEGRIIEKIYNDFFDYALQWAKREIERTRTEKSLPDSTALKRTARDVMAALQTNMIDFALCYMHLNRFMTLVRDGIKDEEMKGIGIISGKDIKWTSDTGLLLGRQKKRRHEIEIFMKNFEKAPAVFDKTEPLMTQIQTNLVSALSREDADRFDISLRSALRTADFKRARTVFKNISTAAPRFALDRKAAETTLASTERLGKAMIDLFESHQDILKGDDEKLFLNYSEMKIISDGMAQELRKIRAYVVKYNLPYMSYKLDTLARLKDKLLVMGSLEGLMTLYRRLITGMAKPIKTLEELRLYEAEVVNRITYLLGSQFAEVKKIEKDAYQLVEEFRAARHEYQSNLSNLLADGGADPVTEAVFNEQAV